MAGCSHRLRKAKARRCCQTNGLAGIAYSFVLTAITPVNSAYAYEFTTFASAGDLQTLPDCRSVRCTGRGHGLQRSLSAA
jgi:hypothetical protein